MHLVRLQSVEQFKRHSSSIQSKYCVSNSNFAARTQKDYQNSSFACIIMSKINPPQPGALPDESNSNGHNLFFCQQYLLARDIMPPPPLIYQIDFSVAYIGKRQKDSKRRIKWVFAIGTRPTRQSQSQRDSGEYEKKKGNQQLQQPLDFNRHEVVFTWSTISGKQIVTIDDETRVAQQWHRSIVNERLTLTVGTDTPTKSTSDSSSSFPIQLHLVCSKTKPTGVHANFRCYELLINDRPFFTYPRLDGLTLHIGYAVEADSVGRPMSILGLLYPGKYYTTTSSNNSERSNTSHVQRQRAKLEYRSQVTTQPSNDEPIPSPTCASDGEVTAMLSSEDDEDDGLVEIPLDSPDAGGSAGQTDPTSLSSKPSPGQVSSMYTDEAGPFDEVEYNVRVQSY